MVTSSDMTPDSANATTADGAASLHVDASLVDQRKHALRRSQVRNRVEDTLGVQLWEAGPDYSLPDNRLVAIYYSKIHRDRDPFLGIRNRIKNDDILVLLLGNEDHPYHLVFPRAETLIRHRESFRSTGGDRMVPPIRVSNGSFSLWKPSKGLEISLDDRIDAYHELLCPPEQQDSRSNKIGRKFVEDDEDALPRAAASSLSDPDLVGRGHRAHKHTRNALAMYLKSLGIQPLDPTPFDPPFDLAWRNGGALYVAEVKSITRENEEHQLRLGLGQLLRYCQLLRKRVEGIVPVLAPELKPRDPEWHQLCKELNIRLVFPPDFENLMSDTTTL
jgi:hypothetical protein